MARQRGGLTDEQVEKLRGDHAAGRRPKVRLSGAQFGDDVTGTVVAIGDPAVDGDDYVTVRVKAQGVTDDLRFAPAELTLPGRTGRAGAASPASPARARRTAAARPAPDGAVREPAAPAAEPAAEPEWTPAPPPAAAKPAPTSPAAAKPAAVKPAAAKPGSAKPAGRRGAGPLPKVDLTITSSGASWSVTARRGARVVVKNAPVQPGVVTAVAALLDHPAVTEAVAAVNEAALREAEERAAALRAELAELEAVLSSHRRP